MNRAENEILTEYQQADFNRRLHLFLEFPDLRTKFTEIEGTERCWPPTRLASQRRIQRIEKRFQRVVMTAWMRKLIRYAIPTSLWQPENR